MKDNNTNDKNKHMPLIFATIISAMACIALFSEKSEYTFISDNYTSRIENGISHTSTPATAPSPTKPQATLKHAKKTSNAETNTGYYLQIASYNDIKSAERFSKVVGKRYKTRIIRKGAHYVLIIPNIADGKEEKSYFLKNFKIKTIKVKTTKGLTR